MRNLTYLVAALFVGPAVAAAQPRGVDLFRRMMAGRLTTTTGVTRVRWLPGQAGYLERGVDSVTKATVFYRVDPKTGRKAPVFDQPTTERLVAEYRRISGRAVSGLPFTEFSYEMKDRAIRFTADGSPWIYRLDANELRKLRQPAKTGPLDQGTQNPGEFSPDFRRYAFIREYDNLFLFDTETGAEERLTTGTGEDNLVGFLGAEPWFVWSPDSKYVGYVKAEQRGFPQYPILRSLDPVGKVELLRYPFTTTPTAPLELWIVNVLTKEQRKIAATTPEQAFIRDLAWLPDGSGLSYQMVNQWDSRVEVRVADPATGTSRTLVVDDDPAYLDPPNNFQVLADGKRFLFSSEKSGWRHLYLYQMSGGEPKQLTSGEWVTAEVRLVDEGRGLVYFDGYTERGLERHFFRVKLDGTGLTKLTPEPGTHVASIDPTGSYFTDDYSVLGTPRTVNLRAADGSLVKALATTNVDSVTALGLEAPELLTITAADGKTPMHGILFKPVGFDPAKRYPVVVSVYGGPHTKAVRNRYETIDFRAQLAQLGFLVAEFDGRGTRLREKSFQTGSYQKLGQVDVDDQAAGVKQLAARPYVDAGRVGVTGLSHGGYLTLMMFLRYPEVYQVAVAGAPLTDVALGPRQYIGRFMRTPDGNAEGYAAANVLKYADRLKGRLLIYHGTNDRNAVLGNTMMLVKKLVDFGKPVDLMIYPDGVHVLTGKDAIHQVKTTVSYFLEHLRPEGWEASRAAIWAQ
jgi:dipeptidyl-peptidase-4